MSGDATSIQAFIRLVEQKSALFSQHWNELKALVEKLPEKNEEIVKVLEKWMEQLPNGEEILNAYDNYLENTDLRSGVKFGGATSPTPPDEPSKPSRELLIQAIQKNSTISDSQPPKK